MPPEIKSVRIDRNVFQQTLEKKLSDLPPLPAVVSKILQTVNDPNSSAEELNRLISMDQGLASKILRIVNSAYYGFPKRISTLTHAVVILGYNTVRNLVLGVSAFGQLNQKSMPYGLNRTAFWEHSVAAAVASCVVAQQRLPRTRNAKEESFIGGLLHDIGALFLDSYFPVQYAVTMAFAAREKKTSDEAESMVLGIDHLTVGRRIAEHWNFPSHLVAMIGEHHRPTLRSEHFDLVAAVHAGDILAWECGYVASEHTQPHALHPDVQEWLNCTPEQWEQMKAQTKQLFEASTALLQVMKERR
jgi:HD-like signal output (HDOD) protein